MAHVNPLNPDQIDDDLIKSRFEHYAATRGFVPNSIRTMAHRPQIAKAFMALNQAVLYEGTVSQELKMLVSLMSSFSAGCLYCQSHMVNLSHLYKSSDEKIAAILDFENSDLFSAAEKAALDAASKASQLPNQLTAKEFETLSKHFDDGQIVEIIASVALFGYLNRWNDSMATTLEPLPSERAERIVGAQGWKPGKHGSSS